MKHRKQQDAAAAAAASPSLTLDQPEPAYGDTVTFTYDTAAAAGPWWIVLTAAIGGVMVYNAVQPPTIQPDGSTGLASPAGASPGFPLGGSVAWQSGAADCLARLCRSIDGDISDPSTTLAEVAFTCAA